MKRLTLDELRMSLPDLEELRPILDDLLVRSEPDATRTWSGSGQLGTAATRLVPDEKLEGGIRALARAEADRLETLYTLVGKAVSALTDGDGHAAAMAFLEAAALEEAHDRADRAAAYADAAYRSVANEEERTLAALALRRSARALRALGELKQAATRYARSNELASAMLDVRGAAEAAIGAGNVAEEQGLWHEAEKWYRAALDSVESLGDDVPERWHALLNLHIVARSQGELRYSASLLGQAEEASATVNRVGAQPFIENARGQLLMAGGAYEEAEEHFRIAVRSVDLPRARVTMRLNLAECFLARGRSLDAAEQAREAEREAISAKVVSKLPEVYRLLGRIAAAEGNADAFVLFERALEIIGERQLPPLEKALTLQAYAEVEEGRGEGDGARAMRDKARAIFAALGITHERQRWVDVFGPPTDDGHAAGGQT